MGALPISDRGFRYRANARIPRHEKRCFLCGRKPRGGKRSKSNPVEVGHVDGHEEHDTPDNLSWVCRSCNVIAGNTLRAAGLGRLTRQFNPTKSGGAANVGEWAQAVGAITPHKYSYRNKGLSSDMPVSTAVAMIRATPHHKRSEFAGQMMKHAAARRRERYNAGPEFGGTIPLTKRQKWQDRLEALEARLEKAKPGSKSWWKIYQEKGRLVQSLAKTNPGLFAPGGLFGSREYVYDIGAARKEQKRRQAEQARRQRESWAAQKKLDAERIREEKRRQAEALRLEREAEREEKRRQPKQVGRYGRYTIYRTFDGEYFSTLDRDSWYPSLAAVRRSIDEWHANPAKKAAFTCGKCGYKTKPMMGAKLIGVPCPSCGAKEWRRNPAKFDRCVRDVKARGGDVNAYAVCTAAGTRGKKGPTAKNSGAAAGRQYQAVCSTCGQASLLQGKKGAENWARGHRGLSGHRVKVKAAGLAKSGGGRRRNPAGAAAEAYEDFHGQAPTEVVTVVRKVHHHRNLAGAGELRLLRVRGVDRKIHKISKFGGALLCFNEQRNQLFIEGGDQSVNLEDYGIRKPHELETLGKVLFIGYHTTKTHLGAEGGTALYVHRFRTTNEFGRHVVVTIARYPDLIYRVRDQHLEFSGGSYTIKREGIDK